MISKRRYSSPHHCTQQRGRRLLALAVAIGMSSTTTLHAAENATGFYLLGAKGPAAGILPPPGVFVQNDVYFYDGRLTGSRTLPLNGRIVADLDVQVWADFLTFLAVAPWDIAGGNLGFTLAIPVGGPKVRASASLAGPGGGPFTRSVSDSAFTLGDLVLGSTLGWHVGNFHWTAGILVNTPVGDYRKGELANLAFHRWAIDFSGALTWFDKESGWDLSAAMGVTVNFKNQVTNYRTGNEFHLEWAASKYFSKEFSAGLIGYHYQQLTGDSGSGAVLGDFKGRVTAVGATMAYTFEIGQLPLSTRLKIYSEFNTKNRLDGTAVFFTASMPLAVFGK